MARKELVNPDGKEVDNDGELVLECYVFNTELSVTVDHSSLIVYTKTIIIITIVNTLPNSNRFSKTLFSQQLKFTTNVMVVILVNYKR